MDIQGRKLEFIEEFIKIQKEDVLARFENLLKKEKSVELKPFSIEELNNRIDKSENDFNNNRFKTSSQILAKYQ
ncbi:hypothetical protein [Wenyingzhuangia aestuarii]|uniref:hypothetical protein n=1 Tax=Wenyingzhuangia aestuarii TaxID=1647582 RepID=UPI00143B68D8|nr:hypothetical protein [Wenyingzhuangia aestuarii]NJB84169.1 hypothetical protein [Wenyingzhuangia aestuarii]